MSGLLGKALSGNSPWQESVDLLRHTLHMSRAYDRRFSPKFAGPCVLDFQISPVGLVPATYPATGRRRLVPSLRCPDGDEDVPNRAKAKLSGGGSERKASLSPCLVIPMVKRS